MPCVQKRFVMCALAVSGVMIGWMTHYSGSNAIHVIIAHPYEHVQKPKNIYSNRCTYNHHFKRKNVVERYNKYGEVYWSRPLVYGVTQSFWLGYIVSTVVGGLLVDRFGPRHVWGIGMIVTSVSALLFHQLTEVGPYALMICITFAGLGQGVVRPCTSVLVAYWAPDSERTTFVAFIESGIMLGWLMVLVLHDGMSIWYSWVGWLYMCGFLCVVWILMWYSLYENPPPSDSQLEYQQTAGFNRATIKSILAVPWKQILVSPPFWSLMSMNAAVHWIQSILVYQVDKYLIQVLNVVSIFRPTGLSFTSMLIVVSVASILWHGWASDWLINRGFMTRTFNRRSFMVFSNFLVALIFLSVPILECTTSLVLMAFFLAVHVHGVCIAPLYANVVDVSPRFAGTIRGITAGSGGLSLIFCRYIVNYTVLDPTEPSSWIAFFVLTIVVVALLSAPYVCFGSGKIQPWNYLGKNRTRQSVSSQPRTSTVTQTTPDGGQNTTA